MKGTTVHYSHLLNLSYKANFNNQVVQDQQQFVQHKSAMRYEQSPQRSNYQQKEETVSVQPPKFSNEKRVKNIKAPSQSPAKTESDFNPAAFWNSIQPPTSNTQPQSQLPVTLQPNALDEVEKEMNKVQVQPKEV